MSRKSEEIAKQKNKIQQLLIGKKIVAIRGQEGCSKNIILDS